MNDSCKEAALQLIEEAVIFLSNNGDILWMNRAALALYDWELSDVVAQSFFHLLDKNQLPSPLPETGIFPSQDIGSVTTTNTYLKPSQKTIEWKLAMCELGSNEQCIALVGKDITETQCLEDKLFELDSIVAQAPGNLYWFDKNNIYLGCNEQSAKVLGMSRQAVVQQNVKHLIRKLSSPNVQELEYSLINQSKKVIETGKPLLNIEEPPSEGADGVLRHYLANKVPLRDRHGKVYGVIGISVDITDLKALEAKLRCEKEKAEASSRSKSEFIANMSHDIRTPITGILAMADHMLQVAEESSSPLAHQTKNTLDRLVAAVREDAPMLGKATRSLLNLCNDILDVVQLEAGKTRKHVEAFNLGLLCQRLMSLLQPVAKDKQLDLSLHLDATVPCYLSGARLYLERILLNLISNALKFTDKGFVKMSVRLAGNRGMACPVAGDTVRVIFVVEDSGMGIPIDKREVIFDHFSRLTASYSGVYKGAGLGLYKVKQYVAAMSGDIQVESDVEKGSCFMVTVPLQVADGQMLSTESDTLQHALFSSPSKNSEVQDAVNRPQAKAITALVVEDSPMAAMGIQMKLKQLHCDVELAKNGVEALQMARSKQYDCIFMDVGLPDLTGMEVTKKIRALSNTKRAEVPIITVTGHAGNLERQQACFDAGMQAVLSKPVELLTLKSAINTYVFHRKRDVSVGPQRVTEHNRENLPVIDKAACLQYCQGKESVLRQMLLVLSQDLKSTQPVLETAYMSRDMQVLRDECHRLRGGVCYLKLPELECCLHAFHEAVKVGGQDDDVQLVSTYAALQSAIHTFREAVGEAV